MVKIKLFLVLTTLLALSSVNTKGMVPQQQVQLPAGLAIANLNNHTFLDNNLQGPISMDRAITFGKYQRKNFYANYIVERPQGQAPLIYRLHAERYLTWPNYEYYVYLLAPGMPHEIQLQMSPHDAHRFYKYLEKRFEQENRGR